MKKFISFALLAALVFSFGACNTSPTSSKEEEPNNVRVEYGETYELPKFDGEYEVVVTDSKGANVRVQYGRFSPKVGVYTVKYTGGVNREISVVCTDTIAPEVNFTSHIRDAMEGTSIEIPSYTIDDKSSIASEVMTVKDNSGNVVECTNNQILVNKLYYDVELVVTDEHGNVGRDTFRVNGHKDYVDANLKENELFTFNEDEYTNLVYLLDGEECFTPSIVESGYPAITGAEAGNKVLKLSTEYEYGEVYTSLVCPVKDFRFSDSYVTSVTLCPDRDIDWVKIKTTNKETAGTVWNLKANQWYRLDIDPILMGYGLDSNTFVLSARATGGLNLYIDEIFYTPNEADPDYVKGVESFDNETYLTRVFQNQYLSTTADYYPEQKDGGGSTYEIVEKYYLGEASSRKVMKITTIEKGGGFTYMFPEALDASKISSIVVTMSHDYDVDWLNFGVIQGNYKCSKIRMQKGAGDTHTVNQYTLSGDDLASGVDGFVTGLWLGVADSSHTGNVLYVDSVKVNYKE